MTDKQIIINGVDVSGCDRLNIFPMQYGEPHEICLTSLEQWGGQEKYCKDRPNCHYKQLEKLKAENLSFKILHESDKDLLKRKEQECEELKKEAVNLKLNLKKVINLSQKKNRQCYQFLADIKQLKLQHQGDKGLITTTEKINYQLLQEYDKLKTAFTEIKEIAEKIDDSSGCDYGDYDCDNCSSLEQETVCTYKVKKLILQKISEVVDG